MREVLKRRLRTALFTIIGALTGLAFYYLAGCAADHCEITSDPVNSMLYMGLIGGLFSIVIETGCAKYRKTSLRRRSS